MDNTIIQYSLRSVFVSLLFFVSVVAAVDKHRVSLSDDPPVTVVDSLGQYGGYVWAWVKFTEVFEEDSQAEESTIFYQNSREIPFHFDFATVNLERFAGRSRGEFDQVTLYNENREAVLGSVIWIATWSNGLVTTGVEAVGIQFASVEPLSREQVVSSFAKVRESIDDIAGVPVYYLPTYEQTASALAERQWLAEHGVEIEFLQRWSSPEAIYAPGWAVGRVVKIATDDIDPAYREGRLRPDDILLTEQVPAEIPFVTGIICTQPATPNSHVAILAKSWNIPFVYLSEDGFNPDEWSGQWITMAASPQDRVVDIRPLDPDIPADILDDLLALKSPPDLQLPPMEEAGTIWIDVDDSGPDDIVFIGGKAANFGVLRGAIPEDSPTAIAFTFDLWNEFLDQNLPARGRSLRDEISARLLPFHQYPPDFPALNQALASIRDMIRSEADFAAPRKEEVLNVLGEYFDADQRIRFRSSTNVEDSDHFTGAGLYDSYSGCLLDDLFPDAPGPSQCNPEEAQKRGVFRAMRRVYASFYNENAFVERLRHSIDESAVGIGILVHHSYPDESEWANGVIVYRPARPEGNPFVAQIEIVTQKGAVSVTNPSGGSAPEVVSATLYSSLPNYYIEQRSSLMLLGEQSVMEIDEDYQFLTNAALKVHAAYVQLRPEFLHRALEFEFKKLAPDGRLEIKQVRPLALEPEDPGLQFLLASDEDLKVYQGEFSNALAIHRNRSEWSLSIPSQRIDSESDPDIEFASISYRRPVDGTVIEWQHPIAAWPGYRLEYDPETATLSDSKIRYSWDEVVAGLDAQRSLGIQLSRLSGVPFAYIDQFQFKQSTHYPRHPLPWHTRQLGPWQSLGLPPSPEDPASELVILVKKRSADLPESELIRWSESLKWAGLRADISLYLPPYPTGFTAGYTAPLYKWDNVRMHGVTTEPLTLREEFAMTYRPGHHNVGSTFIFEPRLDPAIPGNLINELEQRDIIAIMVQDNSQGRLIFLIHADGSITDPLSGWFGKFEYEFFLNVFWADTIISPWFGRFRANDFPYIEQEQLGLLHISGDGSNGLWLRRFMPVERWLWTSAESCPYYFNPISGTWRYLQPGTADPAWWYNYETDQWIAE